MAKERTVKIRTKFLALAILSVLVLSLTVAFATDYPTGLTELFGVYSDASTLGPTPIVAEPKVEADASTVGPSITGLGGVVVTNSGFNVTEVPFCTVLGNTDGENGGSVTVYSYWYCLETDLDGFIFSHNGTGSYVNSTWASFDSPFNNTWANKTIAIDNTLGDYVGYYFYANSTTGHWNMVSYSGSFQVTATITFVKTSGVNMLKDGGSITSGTQIVYDAPDVLNMTAVVSAGYLMGNWSWYSGSYWTTDLSFNFTVDYATTLYLYVTSETPQIPDEPVIPPITAETETLFFYYYPTTLEVNNVTGFAIYSSPPNSEASQEVSTSGSHSVSWGARVWLVYSSTSYELTSGSPVLIGTLTGENSTLMSAEFTFAERSLKFGYGALEVVLYQRWDAGEWSPVIVCISDYLYYTKLLESDATFYLYADRTESGGSTISTASWGTSTFNSGIQDLTFKVARGFDWQQYYLDQGNLLSFLTSPYTAYLGNGIYAIVLFGVGAAIYIRYRNFAVITLLIVLLGGVGGVINLVVGEVFMGAVWIVAAFGLALVYWRVFR